MKDWIVTRIALNLDSRSSATHPVLFCEIVNGPGNYSYKRIKQQMNAQQKPQLIAITDALAGGEAGAITWWTLSGLIDPMALRAAALAHGLTEDDLPKDSTPKKAIRRACQNAAGKRLLARPLSSGAWAMVRERELVSAYSGNYPSNPSKAATLDLDHEMILTCRVDNASETLVFDGVEKYGALRNSIEADYQKYLGRAHFYLRIAATADPTNDEIWRVVGDAGLIEANRMQAQLASDPQYVVERLDSRSFDALRLSRLRMVREGATGHVGCMEAKDLRGPQ